MIRVYHYPHEYPCHSCGEITTACIEGIDEDDGAVMIPTCEDCAAEMETDGDSNEDGVEY